MLIGKLLSRYINEKMERVDTRDDKYQDILQKYDRDMRKYFFDLDDDKKQEILKIENEIS